MTTINCRSDGKNHVSNYQRPRPPPLQVATGYPMPTVAPPPRVYNNASVQLKPQAYPVTQAPPVAPSKNTKVVSQGKDDLPCFGLGLGWLLFIVGFVVNPAWFVGFILLLCDKEPRERAGYIACTVAFAVVTVIIVVCVVILKT